MAGAVAAAAGAWSVFQAPLVRAFTVWDVTDFGAVGDGVTRNDQAINDAVAAAAPGDEIFFPEGAYAVDGVFEFFKSLTFRGDLTGTGASINNVGAAPTGNFIKCQADNFSFIDLAFKDPGGRITAGHVTYSPGFSGGLVQGCTFNTPNARSVIFSNHANGTVDDNIIFSAFEGIRINGASSDMTIAQNLVKNWKQRGIVATGNASGAASNLTVDDNKVRLLDPNGIGTSRSPIQIIPGAFPTLPSGVQVSNNAITGIGTSFRDPIIPGTSDQIHVIATDFEVFGNTSVDGGEGGLTIGPGSHQGSIHDNTVNKADTAGITVQDAWDVDVLNNGCRNNGQNRLNDRPDWARTGILVNNSNTPDINISGNTIGDNQTPMTQCYGISLRCSSDVTVGTNTDIGNKIAFLHQQCP